MPIIKSAKKRVLQAAKANTRNKHYNSRMRTLIKNVVKESDAEKAEKMLPETFSAIDVALKKNLIHKNNAARKKARVTKLVTQLKSGDVVKTEVKKTPAKAKATSQKSAKAAKAVKAVKAAKNTTKKTSAK